MDQARLGWQSKVVLLLVVPFAGTGLVLETHWWATQALPVAIWTIGLSLLLALVVLKLRAATPPGAAAGTVITASLMFSTATFPYQPWHTALAPVLAVSLLAWGATRLGRAKNALGTAEERHGRSAAQVTANLGVAAVACSEVVQSWLIDTHWFSPGTLAPLPLFAPGLAALAEAAADTVSSEIGQVLGARPRMITTLRAVDAGTDGAVSVVGTLAGAIAAGGVAGIGTLALRGGLGLFWVSAAGGVFGLFSDSLLGATLERRGWLNNDAVNFLSTASAAGFALGVLCVR
ncbi:MAG TPA: DUF92 domain-containing protein [Terracidiphilus sp.]|nr:DUF92 domain-containing protein [Terracidiphilus sp.]